MGDDSGEVIGHDPCDHPDVHQAGLYRLCRALMNADITRRVAALAVERPAIARDALHSIQEQVRDLQHRLKQMERDLAALALLMATSKEIPKRPAPKFHHVDLALDTPPLKDGDDGSDK